MRRWRLHVEAGALIVVGIVLAIILPADAASRDPVRARQGMVVAVEPLAAQAGLDILKQGGNAVDAAVAVGFALAVTHPTAGNIGGGGFMVIRLANGSAVAIDYREKAPGKATPAMYLDAKGTIVRNQQVTTKNSKGEPVHPQTSLVGYLAAGVPGTVDGLTTALAKYGTMNLKQVLQPAIGLAEKGFIVEYRLAKSLKTAAPTLAQFPSSAKIFLKPDGQPYQEGDVLVQKDLAETLKRIAQSGRDGFYKGKTAELIERDMAANGGLITREDLSAYRAVIRIPLHGTYRGYDIITMPPPSSGGVALIEMLNILEGYPIGSLGSNSSRTLHLMAEGMRRTYADRAQFLGDTDFTDVPVTRLTSKEHAAQLRSLIDPFRATPSKELGPPLVSLPEEEVSTTHFSVVDKDGNAVSNTYTINGGYGAYAVVEGAGFLLNNEMDDFNIQPGVTNAQGRIGTDPNRIAPNKRMLSSMTPTIVAKDGKPYLVTGSPGGRTIINTTLQVIMNVIDHKMTVQEAVDAPRTHHQWFPDVLNIEGGVPLDVIEALTVKGHTVNTLNTAKTAKYSQGDAHSIMIAPETGLRLGAADSRSSGAAVGY